MIISKSTGNTKEKNDPSGSGHFFFSLELKRSMMKLSPNEGFSRKFNFEKYYYRRIHRCFLELMWQYRWLILYLKHLQVIHIQNPKVGQVPRSQYHNALSKDFFDYSKKQLLYPFHFFVVLLMFSTWKENERCIHVEKNVFFEQIIEINSKFWYIWKGIFQTFFLFVAQIGKLKKSWAK